MTDLEMLKLAAKAAGIPINEWRYNERDDSWHGDRADAEEAPAYWSPLTDDGDALRLAVEVLNWPHGGRAFQNAVNALGAVGRLPKDPYTATRRGIVLAAAAIGEARSR